MTVPRVLDQIRSAALEIPVVVMTYLNPLMAFGLERFVREAAAAGVSGLVLTDFPAGADPELEAMVQASPLALIRLLAPTTTPDRLARAVQGASGFLYLISRLGVTGVRDQVPADLAEHVARVRSASALPLAVGFGISTPAQARATARRAGAAEQVFLSHPDRPGGGGGQSRRGRARDRARARGRRARRRLVVAEKDVSRGARECGPRGDRAARRLRRLRRRPPALERDDARITRGADPGAVLLLSRVLRHQPPAVLLRPYHPWQARTGRASPHPALRVHRIRRDRDRHRHRRWDGELLAAARVGVRGGGARRPGLGPQR